jgi:hypothetical protein
MNKNLEHRLVGKSEERTHLRPDYCARTDLVAYLMRDEGNTFRQVADGSYKARSLPPWLFTALSDAYDQEQKYRKPGRVD